jgi:hypothetical protein
MIDLDTFLITVYVTVDDRCVLPPEPSRPGPAPRLSRSELLTLAIVGQWAPFSSERAFYRYAQRRWGRVFPTLPSRAQFNRLVRHGHDSLVAVGLQVARWLDAPTCAYEILDGMGLATRNVKRRGGGWLAGQADIGLCTRLGWYEGLHLLTAVTPHGAITGFGLAPASTKDQPLAETLLAARATPHAALPSAGLAAAGNLYVLDKGYEGQQWHQRWAAQWGVQVVCPPKRGDQRRRWSRALRRQIAGLRQVVETVHHLLLRPFRLEHERPHCLRGVQARLAAKVALHNLCLWLNQQRGRPLLALADLIDW